MKTPLFTILAISLAIVSCERPAEPASNQKQEALQAEEQRLAAESDRLQREREAVEAEKEELRLMRENALAQREAALDSRELELLSKTEEERLRAEELAMKQGELTARQTELERRALELSEQELEQAGTGVIEDWTPAEPEVVQQPVADYNLFYDELAPHGSWFDTPDYGYVYQPTVVIQNRSWRPYTRGRWVCTNLGWTWRSDEPFGWATFHYGRWALLEKRGWCWVPGSEWAPSWCAWRYGDGHVGWAPLPPETLAYRRSLGASAGLDFGIGHSWFNFVGARHMADPAYRHCLPVKRNRHYYDLTRGCTNLRYRGFQVVAGGPSYKLVKSFIHDPWPVRQLDLNRVGGFGHGHDAYRLRKGRDYGNRLQVFAPSLDAPWNPGLRPKQVAERWQDVRVVRANALKESHVRRFAEVRQRQQETARKLAKANEERRKEQQAKLQRNRERVAAAQERYRENLQRQVGLRQKAGTVPVDQAAERLRDGKLTENPSRNGTRGNRGKLPEGMSRPVEGKQPPFSRGDGRDSTTESPTPVADRLADFRKKQEEARQRQARKAEELRQAQKANQTNKRPANPTTGNATMQERLEQARQQREQATRETAERQARARQVQQDKLREQQEKLRMQQDQKRAAQEQAKETQQQRMREQQEQARAAQEQAKQAAAERARQQQEKLKQQQEAARKAAEERARKQQEAARKAAEERARKQAEMARRQEEARKAAQERARQQQEQARRQQEEARRAAEERARQQQEQARRAAEERARKQQEQQQKLKEAQERMREKIREQQERRKK